MLAWHLSWQLCLSFEHARQFGPLCPGSQSSMAVTGVVVGGPVVGEEEKSAAVTSESGGTPEMRVASATVPDTRISTTHVARCNAAARGMASRVDLLQRPAPLLLGRPAGCLGALPAPRVLPQAPAGGAALPRQDGGSDCRGWQ